MAYKIDQSRCIGCRTCMGTMGCQMGAISVGPDGKTCIINPEKCISCGMCASVCPAMAIEPAQ